MEKLQQAFICEKCGTYFSRWQGKCSQCGQWNTLVETKVTKKSGKSLTSSGKPEKISETFRDDFERIKTNIGEFDRVLGGGVVPGSVILIGGDPGIGKSTLVLQISNMIAEGKKVLYVSGEESNSQIGLRAKRLGLNAEKLLVLSETSTESIIETAKTEKPGFMVIDSIQTVSSDEIVGSAGAVSQVSFSAQKIINSAKSTNTATLIIGHVTKEGSLAGPRILEHLVDVVLYLEGNRYGGFRVVRGVKNRFGPTDEAGIFDMTDKGMVEVKNPSELLLSERDKKTSGISIFPMMEGTRPLLVEVQTLVSLSSFGYPKRTASGMDLNRLQLLIAIVSKRMGLNFSNQDVYLNVVGGLMIKEPAIDLAVVLSLVSAYRNKPVPSDIAVFGEVGLAGEVRNVNNIVERVKEAKKLGFNKIIVPKGIKDLKDPKVARVSNINEACGLVF